MKDKKEGKRLMKFAKRILDKSSLKKLKKVGEEDKMEAIKYSMKCRMEREHGYLEEDVKKMKKAGKDTFFIETKLSLLKSKIKLFNATLHKSDFINMANLFKQIEKEMKHVQSV